MPEAQAGIQHSPEAAERVKEAIQRLRERGALKDDRCPQCGTDDWNVDFIAIPAVFLPKDGLNIPRNVVMHVGLRSGSPPSYISALTLVCQNCGNTMIHNLKVLGLSGEE